jgi:hypothetical protein
VKAGTWILVIVTSGLGTSALIKAGGASRKKAGDKYDGSDWGGKRDKKLWDSFVRKLVSIVDINK